MFEAIDFSIRADILSGPQAVQIPEYMLHFISGTVKLLIAGIDLLQSGGVKRRVTEIET